MFALVHCMWRREREGEGVRSGVERGWREEGVWCSAYPWEMARDSVCKMIWFAMRPLTMPNFTSWILIAGYYFRYWAESRCRDGWGALFAACSPGFVERRLPGLSGRGRCVRLRS